MTSESQSTWCCATIVRIRIAYASRSVSTRRNLVVVALPLLEKAFINAIYRTPSQSCWCCATIIAVSACSCRAHPSPSRSYDVALPL